MRGRRAQGTPAARRGATSRLSGQEKGPGTRKWKGKGMPGPSGRATSLYVGSDPRASIIGCARAGFRSSPHGYEELHNPVRAATHYTYIASVTHRRPSWGNLARLRPY